MSGKEEITSQDDAPPAAQARYRLFKPSGLVKMFTAVALGVSALTVIDNLLGPAAYYPSRPLTDNEIAFSQTIFGKSLNYDKIRIVRVPERSFHAWAADADGFVGPSIVPQISMVGDTNYCEDYASPECGVSNASLFSHEMAHIWQRAGNVPLVKYVLATRTYDYDLSEEPDFNRLGIEQQAEAVYDYVDIYAYRKFNNQICRITEYGFDPLLVSTIHGRFDAAARSYGDFIAGVQPDVASGPRRLTEFESRLLSGIFGDQIDISGVALFPYDNGTYSASLKVTKCDIQGACVAPDATYEISIGANVWQDDYAHTTNEEHLERFIGAAMTIAEGRSSCAYRSCGFESFDTMADVARYDKPFADYSNYVQTKLLTIYANAYFVHANSQNCTFYSSLSTDGIDYTDYLVRVTELVEEAFPAARSSRIANTAQLHAPTDVAIPNAAQPG